MLLLDLPPEILLKTISLVNLSDVVALRQSCKQLDLITRDRSIWLSMMEQQKSHYPICDISISDIEYPTAAQLENVVKSSHTIDHAWMLPRRKSPVKIQYGGPTKWLLYLEMFLDRWLLAIYSEREMYLWDTFPGSNSRIRLCASVDNKNQPSWTSAVAKVSQDRQTLVVASHLINGFCQIWEVPLRSNTAFTPVRTIETRWKTVKAISLSENIIATSYGGLIYVATNSDLPVKLIEAEYPHLENVDPETGESVQPLNPKIDLFGRYLVLLRVSSVEVYDTRLLLAGEVGPTSRLRASPVQWYTELVFNCFANARTSSLEATQGEAPDDVMLHVYSYGRKLPGLYQHTVHWKHRSDSCDLSPLLISRASDSITLPIHHNTPSRLCSRTCTSRSRSTHQNPLKPTYVLGPRGIRGAAIQGFPQCTVKELLVWNNWKSFLGSPVAYTFSVNDRSDIKDDITFLALSESNGLLVMASSRGDIYFLGIE